MSGENGYQENDYEEASKDLEDNVESQADSEDVVVVVADDDGNDNVGDMSVEINVEELVAKIESDDASETARKREVRRRLEELEEKQRTAKELDSTYNFNLDDDT